MKATIDRSRKPCLNPQCRRSMPAFPKTDAYYLCSKCAVRHTRTCLPLGGYIPSDALKTIARELIKNTNKAEMAEAVRMMRGSRYPRGNWDERPVYRVVQIKHGTWDRRLPHVLVGKKKQPTPLNLTMGFVHFTLARTVLEQGRHYARYLAAVSFYGTRGPFAPKGRSSEAGPKPTFNLRSKDFLIIGTHVLRASAKAGLPESDRSQTALITSRYLEGCRSGEFHTPVWLPFKALPTPKIGDHPLAHTIPEDPHIPPAYRWTVRRADGKIKGQWPSVPWETPHVSPEAVPEAAKKEPTPRPDPSWLFE